MAEVIDRSKESATPLVLFTYRRNAVVVTAVADGVTVLVAMTVAVPAPNPVVAALPALAVPAGALSERAVF